MEVKQYISLPVTGGIDKALDALEERTGTDFPLADLLSDNPAEAVASGVTSGGKVGTPTIDGVRCNHFFFDQAADDLELELWLEDNQQAVPRRFVVTYRSLPGRPIFIAELSGCRTFGVHLTLLLPLLPAALLSNSLWTAIHAGFDQLPKPVLSLFFHN